MFFINTFFFFSILGYIYEMILHFLEHNIRNQILIGPWMPIYGIGIIITELLNRFLSRRQKGFKKIIYCFFFSIIILTILEELGGLLIEKMFCTKFWNYESIPLSIGPYINILISILWGFFAMILEYVVLPITSPFLKKIPKWVSILCIILLLIDNIINIYNKSCLFDKRLTLMRFIEK